MSSAAWEVNFCHPFFSRIVNKEKCGQKKHIQERLGRTKSSFLCNHPMRRQKIYETKSALEFVARVNFCYRRGDKTFRQVNNFVIKIVKFPFQIILAQCHVQLTITHKWNFLIFLTPSVTLYLPPRQDACYRKLNVDREIAISKLRNFSLFNFYFPVPGA